MATSRAMIGLTAAVDAGAADHMPCHAAADAEFAADADRDILSRSHGCVCTPWCAFIAASAAETFDVVAPGHGVLAGHRPIGIKIAAVDPPFEPPRR